MLDLAHASVERLSIWLLKRTFDKQGLQDAVENFKCGKLRVLLHKEADAQ
jgi:hypothetical protein